MDYKAPDKLISDYAPAHKDEYLPEMEELKLKAIKEKIKKKYILQPDEVINLFGQIEEIKNENIKIELIKEISFKKYLLYVKEISRKKIVKIINQNPMLYDFIPEGYKYDEGIINLAIKKNSKIFKFIPSEKKGKYLKEAITKNVNNFGSITNLDLINFPYTVIELAKDYLQRDVNNFKFFTFELKNNEEVVKKVKEKLCEIIEKKNISCLRKISYIILGNKNIMYDILLRYPIGLRYCSLLNNDCEIVLAAVSQNGNLLEFASHLLKTNRDIVLAAVSQSGSALKYAYIKDRDIVLTAVRQNGNSYKYASDTLKEDKEIVLVSYYNSRNFFHYYSDGNKEKIIEDRIQNRNKVGSLGHKIYQKKVVGDVFYDNDLRREIGSFF